jgi:hypothetical protein
VRSQAPRRGPPVTYSRVPIVMYCTPIFLAACATAASGLRQTERYRIDTAMDGKRQANLPVTSGLIVDLRGNTGINGSTWHNQVSGQPDATMDGTGITYLASEKAFDFTPNQGRFVVNIAADANSMTATTWACWVYLKSRAPSGEKTWLMSALPDYGWNRALVIEDPRLNYVGVTTGAQTSFPFGELSLNTWHHLVGVWTGNGQPCYVCLNGACSDTTATTCTNGAGNDATEYVAIGGRYLNATHNGDIQISDVAIFTRALTDIEVGTLYNGGARISQAAASHAVGDPHCVNVRGERFNVYTTGNVTMLQVPRKESSPGQYYRLRALIVPVSNAPCAPTVITQLHITGSWLGNKPSLTITASPQGLPEVTEAWRDELFGPSHNRVVHYKNGNKALVVPIKQGIGLVVKPRKAAASGVFYFDLVAVGLPSLGDEAGGLLGVDTHDEDSQPPPGCNAHTPAALGRASDLEGGHAEKLVVGDGCMLSLALAVEEETAA